MARGFEQLVLRLHSAALQPIALYDKLNPCFVAIHAFGHYVFEDWGLQSKSTGELFVHACLLSAAPGWNNLWLETQRALFELHRGATADILVFVLDLLFELTQRRPSLASLLSFFLVFFTRLSEAQFNQFINMGRQRKTAVSFIDFQKQIYPT